MAAFSRSTGSGGGGGRNWQGSVTYLCLIICLTQDHVNYLFLSRADSRSRQESDAHNSKTRWVRHRCIACAAWCFCHDSDYAMQLLSDKLLTLSLVLCTANTDHQKLYLKSSRISGIARNSIQLLRHQIAISISWLQKIVPMSMWLDSLQPHRQGWKT
jgi:hypothetical protein